MGKEEGAMNLGKFVPDPTCPACNGDKISKTHMSGWKPVYARADAASAWYDTGRAEWKGAICANGNLIGYLKWRCDECGCSWNTLSASGE